VKFSPDGPEGVGPEGVYHPDTFRTSVSEPITINVWAFDRGDRELRDVNMTLWKYRGPVGGEVTFVSLVPPPPPQEGRGGGPPPDAAEPQGPTVVEVGESIPLSREGEMANQGRFTASFGMPGEYVLRVRIDNFTSGDSSPGNNCCWSNGYVRVVVTD
jgi:hypothetical protein